jgi:hypothetical protein
MADEAEDLSSFLGSIANDMRAYKKQQAKEDRARFAKWKRRAGIHKSKNKAAPPSKQLKPAPRKAPAPQKDKDAVRKGNGDNNNK